MDLPGVAVLLPQSSRRCSTNLSSMVRRRSMASLPAAALSLLSSRAPFVCSFDVSHTAVTADDLNPQDALSAKQQMIQQIYLAANPLTDSQTNSIANKWQIRPFVDVSEIFTAFFPISILSTQSCNLAGNNTSA